MKESHKNFNDENDIYLLKKGLCYRFDMTVLVSETQHIHVKWRRKSTYIH